MQDPRRRIVRAGYDTIGERYLAERPTDGADMALLPNLLSRLTAGDAVLDAGCGADMPLTRRLIDANLKVTGLDISFEQLRLASERAGGTSFAQGDLAALPFPDRSFRAVTSYYAVIHVPRSDHPRVLDEFHRVLVAGGFALLCLGANDLPEDHDLESWLGAPMYWSHFDATTNITMLRRAGFEIVWQRLVADPMNHPHHLFVLASRT